MPIDINQDNLRHGVLGLVLALVEIIIEKLAYGETIEDLKRDYPFLTEDDIRAALLYAAKRLANEEIYAA